MSVLYFGFGRRFGARGFRTDAAFSLLFRHASVIASPSISSSTVSSRTAVHPCSPHAPFSGLNASGASRTNRSCCSGVNLTIPHCMSACSVAKMRPFRRKSGWPMCALSITSVMARAIRRKSFAVMITPSGFAPRTPLHALSRAASPARSVRVARFAALALAFTLSRDALAALFRSPSDLCQR
jgi:hypothetical protein